MSPTYRGPGRRDQGPMGRAGWLVWAAWLVFLVFPVIDALGSRAAVWARVATLAATALFALVYLRSSARLARRNGSSDPWALLALVALALATVPVVGFTAMSFLPFLAAFVIFALPRPWCWVGAGAILAFTVLLPLVTGTFGELFYFALIVFAVSMGTGAGRLMSETGAAYAEVERRLSVIAERDRVARDVHDVLGHSLTVVTMKAELAERLVGVDPDRARTELAEIQALSRQALAEIRQTVGGLRTARLEDELAGAAVALRAAGIEADLPDDPEVLDPRHRAVAAWVVREAVTNVVRHSGAERCAVELSEAGLVVLDDGCGAVGVAAGNGLRGLRERVEASGGRLDLGGGNGTRVEVAW